APTVGPLLTDADASVRMAAVDCVAALKLTALGQRVVPLLNDAEWQVQTAAVGAVGKLRPSEATPPLIELVRKAGRMRSECAVESLTQDTLFDIIAFATDLHPWKGRLVPANIVNREAARSFIERLKPIGGTDDQELAQAGLSGLTNLSAGKTNTLKALLYSFN